MSPEKPRSSRKTGAIVAGVAAIAVLLVLVVAIESPTTRIPGFGVAHRATITYDTIPLGAQSWSVEVYNSGQEPIVGISIVRVVATFGNQTTNMTGIEASPFELLDKSCSSNCQAADFAGPVSTTLPLNPGQDAYEQISVSDQGASQVFQECGAHASPCIVNLLVTYDDGELGVLSAPISSG